MTQWNERELQAWDWWRQYHASTPVRPPSELHERILDSYPRALRQAARRRRIGAVAVSLALAGVVALLLPRPEIGQAPSPVETRPMVRSVDAHELGPSVPAQVLIPALSVQGPCADAFTCVPESAGRLEAPRMPTG